MERYLRRAGGNAGNPCPRPVAEVVALLESVRKGQSGDRQGRAVYTIGYAARTSPRRTLTRFWMIAVLGAIFGVAGCVLAAVIIHVETDKGKLKITVEDPNLEVTVRGKTVHLENRKLGRSYALAIVPGKREVDRYEIEVTEKPPGLKVVTRKLELPGAEVVIVDNDPPPPKITKKTAYDPTHEDLKAYYFVLLNKRTGKAIKGRLCEDPRRVSEVLLVRKEEASKWKLRPQSDLNWVLEIANPWSACNLTFVREDGRIYIWAGIDQTCRWKRVELDGAFALQTSVQGLAFGGYYLTADAKGDGVHLSKDLTEGSKWTFERVRRK